MKKLLQGVAIAIGFSMVFLATSQGAFADSLDPAEPPLEPPIEEPEPVEPPIGIPDPDPVDPPPIENPEPPVEEPIDPGLPVVPSPDPTPDPPKDKKPKPKPEPPKPKLPPKDKSNKVKKPSKDPVPGKMPIATPAKEDSKKDSILLAKSGQDGGDGPEKSETEDGGEMIKTASHHPVMILVGGTLLLAGSVLFGLGLRRQPLAVK